MEQAKPIMQNLAQNGLSMSDTDFNGNLTQLAGMVTPEHQQDFSQWADQARKMRTIGMGQQSAMALDQGSANINNDQFASHLTNITRGAQAAGADPSQIQQTISGLSAKRLSGNADGSKSGLFQSVASGVANPFQQLGLTMGGAIAARVGEVATTVGNSMMANTFLEKYFPSAVKAGKSLSDFGQSVEGQVAGAMQQGVDTGYTGVVAPAGSIASNTEAAGAMSHNEAIARGSLEALGDVVQVGAMLNPEGGILQTAGVMGVGAAATSAGKGESAAQAATSGAATALLGTVFGVGAHIIGMGASSIIGKVLRSEVGSQLMQGVSNLVERGKDLFDSGAMDTRAGQSALEEQVDKLAIAKSGIAAITSEANAKTPVDYFNNLVDEVRQGSTEAYGNKTELFGSVFNHDIRLSGDDLSGVADSIKDETGKLGIKDGEDLVGKFSKARNAVQQGYAGVAPQMMPGADALDSEAATTAGISPEDLGAVKGQLDQAPDDVEARGAFSQWVNRLRNITSRPQGADTAALQTYLNPPTFKGKYDAIATRISNALRDDLEGKFDEEGLLGTYREADSASKTIANEVTTKFRGSIFDAPNQSELERQIVSGEVKANEAELNGMTKMMSDDTKQGLQKGLINEVKRQVDEAVANGSSVGDPNSGYEKGASIINKFIDRYKGTALLNTTDQTNLATWSQLLQNDFSKDFTTPMGEDGSVAAQIKPDVERLQTQGKMVSAAQGVLDGMKQGDPTIVAKNYDKLTSTQQDRLFSSMDNEVDRISLATTILGEKIKSGATDFADAVEEKGEKMTREEAKSAFSGTIGTYEDVMADSSLWNALSETQRSTITEAVNTFKVLDSLKGTKYLQGLKQLATSPLLTLAGHPMASVMELLRGSKNLTDAVFANMGEVSPTEMNTFDSLMQSVGKDTPTYRIFSAARNVLGNKALGKAVNTGATVLGSTRGH